MQKDTTKVENLIERFDDVIEDNEQLSAEEQSKVISAVTNRKELEDGLYLILDRAKDYKEKVDNCDINIKNWQASKKMWAGRAKALMETMGALMKKLNLPDTLKADGIKLTTSTRTVLEVDEDWLIGQYAIFADQLRKQLPDYVKVSLTIDKNKLFAYVKGDAKMLMENPEKIHTSVSSSTTIK